MMETIESSIFQLERKGCKRLDNILFVPIDHGCGNKSFGRMDNLTQHNFKVIYLKMAEKTLGTLIRKMLAEENSSSASVAIDIVNGRRK